MAYQLDRPDLGQGLVVALRRPQSPYQSARFPLRALDENASYRITHLDTQEQTTRTGSDLAKTGLEIRLQTQPDSALLLYQRN